MRKAFKLFAFAAGVVAVAVSCNKEIENSGVKDSVKFCIRAGAPATKSAITNNGDGTYTPSWSAGDAIGVFFTEIAGEPTEFVNEDAGETALFVPSEEITGVSGDQTLYAFYPNGAFNVVDKGKFRINLKDTQTPPSVGTFDPAADILVAKPYPGNISTIVSDGGIIDLAFARILSVVKVTPTDGTPDGTLSGEYVKSVKIEYNGDPSTTDAPLSGRVVLDLETGELGEWTIKTYSVSAGYGDNVFALNGTNAAYLLVNPITIASGKTVTFTVKTNKHDATKSITLENPLSFPAGNIATIGLNINNTWTITDNTLDPNIIFQTPFYADISSNTTYNQTTHGDLGVVGSSKSSITYAFEGSNQLRNNSNKISADDGSFYWCTSSTGLVIGGINVGTNQYFNLSFDRKVPSGTANMTISISKDGTHYFPITASDPVDITGTTAANNSYNFSIPAGEYTNLSLRFANSGSGLSVDNVTLKKLSQAGESNKSVSFIVEAVDPTLVVTPSPVDLVVGNTKQLSVTGTNGALTFLSNNTSVATVSTDGLVTAVAAGTTTIDITSAATEDYNSGATSVTVNISAALTFETIVISETWTADLKTTSGNNAKFVDDGQGIWTVDGTYGHKAANNAKPASFYSPIFDMKDVTAGKITFSHTGNLLGTDYQSLGKAYYSLNGGEWTQISLTAPSSNWSWETATVESSVYAGKTIQFRWDYQGNSSKTWEVKDFAIIVPVFSAITFGALSSEETSAGCSFTASVDGNAISNNAVVQDGKTVTLSATAGTGYVFSSWKVYKTGDENTTVAVSSGSFTMPVYPVTITALFTSSSGPVTIVEETFDNGNSSNDGNLTLTNATGNQKEFARLGSSSKVGSISYKVPSASASGKTLYVSLDVNAWSANENALEITVENGTSSEESFVLESVMAGSTSSPAWNSTCDHVTFTVAPSSGDVTIKVSGNKRFLLDNFKIIAQ